MCWWSIYSPASQRVCVHTSCANIRNNVAFRLRNVMPTSTPLPKQHLQSMRCVIWVLSQHRPEDGSVKIWNNYPKRTSWGCWCVSWLIWTLSWTTAKWKNSQLTNRLKTTIIRPGSILIKLSIESSQFVTKDIFMYDLMHEHLTIARVLESLCRKRGGAH